MARGAFIDFLLSYEGRTADWQAVAILTKGKQLLAAGYPAVAITYSANEDQTRKLIEVYAKGQYTARIIGENQAEVMTAMETQLGKGEWTALQMKMQIAPITTIPRKGTDPLKIVQDDIARIRKQLDKGFAILGWQNQTTVGSLQHPYAIGGGIQKQLPSDVERAIQGGLKKLAADYPPPP